MSPVPGAAFDHFGPLRPMPGLDIVLPPGSANWSVNGLSRVDGGVLLSFGTWVGVINLDGTIRWARCLVSGAGLRFVFQIVAPPDTHPTTALIGLAYETVCVDIVGGACRPAFKDTYEYRSLSLADGRDSSAFGDAVKSAGLDPAVFALLDAPTQWPSGPAVLFGQNQLEESSRLFLYDLPSNTMREIPPPPGGLAGKSFNSFNFDKHGNLAQFDTNEPSSVLGDAPVSAVYFDGTWSTDPSVRLAAFPIKFNWNAASQLYGFDALGKTVWTDATLTLPAYHQMQWAVDGSVAILDACTAIDQARCVTFTTVGLDLNTGTILWTLPGFRFITASSDGYVLTNDGPAMDTSNTMINPAPGWVLLDDRTGSIVDPSQHWSGFDALNAHFEEVAGVDGGLLYIQDFDHLRIWYPIGTSTGTGTLAVP